MKKIKLLFIAVATLISGSAMAQKLVCPDVTLKDGKAELVFEIAENTDETATLVEFTLGMPEGISIEKDGEDYIVDKGSICQRSHSAVANVKDDGDMLVIIMNTSGAAFKSANGELAIIPIVAKEGLADGIYPIQVKKVNITNKAAQKIAKETEFTINVANGTTGINEVNADGMQADGKYLKAGRVIIKKGNRIFNAVGGIVK